MAAVLLVAALGVLAVAPAASAGPSRQQRAKARVALKQIVERVDETTAHRFGAHDDLGAPLQGLKVEQIGGRYIGVYHSPGDGRYNVHVATSTNLIDWTRQATLDTDASQPTIQAMPGGSIIVVYEKTLLLDLLPRADFPTGLLGPLDILDSPFNRIRLRFRYYRSVDALLSGDFSRQFTAPRTLSPTAEGTPSITDAKLRRGLTSRSRIEVGMHYYADLDHNGTSDADRAATGVLTNFKTWKAKPKPDLNTEMRTLKVVHAGFSGPPMGAIGDRDQIILDGVRLELQEAQYVPGDYSSWRTFLIDPRSRVPRPLEIVTEGGSHSFGNPTATALTSPSGKRAVFVTLYVFSEGAASGEAGPLIYYVER